MVKTTTFVSFEITIKYSKVLLSITTHDEGGMTKKDFRLAKAIEESL